MGPNNNTQHNSMFINTQFSIDTKHAILCPKLE